jgi:anti-anti-sigma factor
VPEGSSVRVRALGSLDLATVPLLQARVSELREAGWREFVIDLSGLEFMDSTGLRLILQWDADARQDGWGFSLVPGRPAVQRVFEVTGMLHRLPFAGD